MAKIMSDGQTCDVVRGLDAVVKILSETGGGGGNDDACKPIEKAETLARMKECAARLLKLHLFKKGQLVQWKEGLKNKRKPAYGEPIIVVDVLKEPAYDYGSKTQDSPYFYEPLNLVAGEIAPNGEFACFHYDGRRFEPYQQNQKGQHNEQNSR